MSLPTLVCIDYIPRSSGTVSLLIIWLISNNHSQTKKLLRIIIMINLKKKIFLTLIVAPTLLALSMPSHASRIYNKTSVAIEVIGSLIPVDTSSLPVVGDPMNNLSFNRKVTLNPGKRSKSIDWSESYGVIVADKNGAVMCDITFGFGHAEVVGGNYLVVAQDKEVVKCFVCSTSKKSKGHGMGLINEKSGANLDYVV
jgi:hypothetical protein